MEETSKGRNGGHRNGWRKGPTTVIAQDRTLWCTSFGVTATLLNKPRLYPILGRESLPFWLLLGQKGTHPYRPPDTFL